MLKKTHRLRLLLLAVLSAAAFGVIIWRMYVVQIVQHREYADRALRQQNKRIKLIPQRGDILDRNGLKLATSYVSNTIYLDTRAFGRAERRFTSERLPAEEDATTSDGTTSAPRLLAPVLERLAQQKIEEAAKDRQKARRIWEHKNKAKARAWDDLGISEELIDELAEAFCTPAAPLQPGEQPDPADAATSATVPGARRMSHARAREVVRSMLEKPKRHLFYRKAPEELTRRMLAIEARYALPDGLIVYEKHNKRFYPNGSLASHVLGYTTIDFSGDNVGTAGVERQYDAHLKGRYATQTIQISSGQHGLAPLDESVLASTYGNHVVLTLDSQLQMHAERALRTQVGRYQAKGGIALVMDVHTGGILAMASCPDYDANDFKHADPALQLKNRILTDPIEIGSVMKIITATLLIDNGLLNPNEIIDCSSPKVFGTRVVRDVHSMGAVPFRAAFAESSNVGLVTVGLRLEPTTYYDGLVRFGLGQTTQVDLPGEGNGVLRSVDKWSALSRSSLPMGYETSMTPLQVVSALSAIANDGVRLRPHLIREVRSPQGAVVEAPAPRQAERVAKPETCATIRELMEAVVIEGTGKAALIPGYRVGGKTGTTVKYNIRNDAEGKRRYYSSFAGLFPIDNPRVAIYTYVDEPQGAKYGGTVAAPIFREIAVAAAQSLAIPPSDPVAFAQAGLQDLSFAQSLATSGTLLATTGTLEHRLLAEADAQELHPAPAEGKPALPGTPAGGDAHTTAAWQAIFASDPAARPAPDLRGLTLAATYARLAELGLEAELQGAGIATHQQPPPGAPLRKGEKLKLTFMLASERTPPPVRLLAGLKPEAPAERQPHTPDPAPAAAPTRAKLEPVGGGPRRMLHKPAGPLPEPAADDAPLPAPEESSGDDTDGATQ